MKQTFVARSSTEAEYRALASTTTELAWVHQLLAVLALPLASQTTLYYDNFAAISLAHNPILHAKTKHIEINYHLIRDCIRKNHIKL